MGVHMKRVLLVPFLVVFCASPGIAAAQSLDGLTDPLKDAVDKVSNPSDNVKDVVDEVTKPVVNALPPVVDSLKNPVADVGKAADNVVKDVTDAAKVPSGADNPATGGSDAPSLSPSAGNAPSSGGARTEHSASGASATETKIARTSGGSAKVSKGANSQPAHDTQQVAAAGITIKQGEVKGSQIGAPATDVDEGGASGLSLTGAQILTWLIVACGLLAAGAAFNLTGRLRQRAVRS
jgi:hypothetical protein